MVEQGTLRTVLVHAGARPYPVHIGPGARRLLPGALRGTGARRVVIVRARTDTPVPDSLLPSASLTVSDGEQAKALSTVEGLCERFAEHGLTKADAVVACGGGSLLDTVGLAAALYHRGVAVVHLPTTLLAQVDASVGGKTAVNLSMGKNLVGTYWQPAAVLCDTTYLDTLPRREWTNGFGEIARCHFIGGGDLRALPLIDQITRSVALKAAIVAADERDSGPRHVLNYGHTLGHAIEVVSEYRVRHGEAVGIGTVLAGRLAHALGRITAERAAEHQDVVHGYGLPTVIPPDLPPEPLLEAMARDKKTTNGLSFVLDGPRGVELVTDVPVRIVAAELAAMRAEPTPAGGGSYDPIGHRRPSRDEEQEGRE
ncbi:MAG: 3-dehydroquinate synthase family protein [Frankiaceae bacterium]